MTFRLNSSLSSSSGMAHFRFVISAGIAVPKADKAARRAEAFFSSSGCQLNTFMAGTPCPISDDNASFDNSDI